MNRMLANKSRRNHLESGFSLMKRHVRVFSTGRGDGRRLIVSEINRRIRRLQVDYLCSKLSSP